MSPCSDCGHSRAEKKAPIAIFLLQVRGDYEESSVKAFVDDLQRRNLEVAELSFRAEDAEGVPAETLQCLKLFGVAAPREHAERIDVGKPPSGCVGDGDWQQLDPELFEQWRDMNEA